MSIDRRISSAARLLVPGMRIGAVLLLVVFAAWSGIGDAGDRSLRQAFYDVRGDRDTNQDVILVAIDGPTVAALGAPPWKGTELSTIAGTIAAASPRALGVVDDPARIGKLPQSVISGPVGLVYGNGTVESVRVGDATDPTATARIAAAARVSLESRVNFIGERGLPTVSAIDVSRGAIPKQTFSGRIVVIGITAQPHAGYVPTPVGALAPAQVQAHALATTADGAAWTEVPSWLLWLVIAAAIALVLVFAHLMPRFG